MFPTMLVADQPTSIEHGQEDVLDKLTSQWVIKIYPILSIYIQWT